ncbi:helicase with zinc finger domain 2 isoform X2 [Haplochromis burtoni]|uniref:helicase with zinc finger domain 2 isoform X2 n=1 Tax=Haplochromis burtoni TaxID=8153 RepID=UPI0003BD513E|nr:helicase with zinc finger domain 2 isoform X2 [Haplochromis burtoni]
MSASASRLSPLLLVYDLKLVCTQCSVKEQEITYRLKSVQHKCGHNVLLCKAKGGIKWRPVSRRPIFPNPNKYMACWYYVEGRGCTQHKNRCTFARSDEEAAVWTFEKHQGLDHALLCNLIAESERGTCQANIDEPLGDLLADVDLKAVCNLCSVKVNEITYNVQSVVHKCRRSLLLAKGKASDLWKLVSKRPTLAQTVCYKVCKYIAEDSRCTQHTQGRGCTYAKSLEEATVWNYLREKKMDKNELIRLLTQSVSLTPEHAAESMLRHFSGEFIEVCKDCFQEHPQKLTTKRWNDFCAADIAHAWNPVLVYHLSENSRKHVYSQVRPLPPNCQFTYCSYVIQGKPCWHTASECQSAQSEVEMAVWKAEHTGLCVRPHLLQLSQPAQTQPRKVTMYCKVCHLSLSSPESFYKHCASLEHAQLVAQDTTTRWRGREVPHNRRAELWLCERPQTCEYGSKCPKAHSMEELQEWMMRAAEEKEIKHNIQAQGLMSYNDMLLEEYKNSSNEVYIMSEHVDDVSISCDEDSTVECQEINATLKWNFQIETERELVHVALLKQEPGASFTLGDADSEPCIYSSGEPFLREDGTYDITLSFTSINPGLYRQWLVLDFDMRPVLLKKLKVRVGHSVVTEQPAVSSGARFQSCERWHRGNRIIIPCSSRTEEQDELLKMYKPPQISFLYKSSHNIQTPLNNENYKERMHHFLYNEECAEDQVVSRLNVCGEITALDTLYSLQFGVEAPWGQLFGVVLIPCHITQDSPEGLTLQRSIRSALIAPLTSRPNSKVYEASVLPYKTTENKLFLLLSKQCCFDLALKRNESYQMEVQFQLDRLNYCTMHRAVDLLPDTKTVLPVLKSCVIPVGNITCENLNTKQQLAIGFITGNSNVKNLVAPLLIYGPFGTGKTFTLATAARELCKDPQNKVLICTHTNSSADLYVREHFHPIISKKNGGIRPIRIKANKQGTALHATDSITLKYCLLSEEGHYFLPPTKAALDQHNIIITTTTMARHFHDLNLPEGYFTHILIDEASQMLECEALMALGLAGSNTRVVLAGDHMQMGPKLLSVPDHDRSNHTLLTRLFHYYQGQNCDAAKKSRIILHENYRSTREIVEFVATHFYVGKNDFIKAAGDVPAPTNCHALKFHHVRGECLLETVSMSWYNNAEVTEVVEVVKDILKHWPASWGHKDQSSICILSEGFQVPRIRTALSSRNLANIKVERVANVQGKQFRAVIMTTVQTRDSLKTSHLPGLEMFNDARVLNTAMTRAQSHVVVIGDAAALCCFGKCSGIWKSFINHCINSNSVAPQHFTKEFFEQDIMETVKFQKFEHVDESHTLDDAILKELKDDYEQLKTDEDSLEFQMTFSNHDGSRALYNFTDTGTDLLKMCKKQPEIYKHGKFFRESHRKGYVIPFHNPTKQISIVGQANLGKAFTGDQVVLHKTEVVSITKKEESARVLLCLLEDEDHSKSRQNSESKFIRRMMIPIKKSEPKICILILKKQRNYMPIWEEIDGEWTVATQKYIDENLKQNSLFKVQVICWNKDNFFPLGYIIDILPVGSSLDSGLKILNEEFKVAYHPCKSDKAVYNTDENNTNRQDLRKIITFTVDPAKAKILDDAISVRELEDHYELGLHIADVASVVKPGDDFDRAAEQSGTTYYCAEEKPIYMFPQDLSIQLSLQEGQDRRVVSLMFKAEKDTNKITGKPKFQLSTINSDKQLSYLEAEDIISKSYKETPKCDTVEHCVTVAYCFAKAQRKIRLESDWAYSQTDADRLPGQRKAHLMIEELAVLFNQHASKTLISCDKTRYSTPLRCQAKPDPVKVEEFKEECGEFIPLSFLVRHKVDHEQQSPKCQNFRILPEVWKEIVAATRTDDTDKMIDLVAADEIHPLVQPVTQKFRRCFSKAYFICSKSSPEAEIGHYSLNLKSYTKASSPIRQYMDVILQRLLHSYICNTDVQYTKSKIMALCSQFQENLKNAEKYEQKAEQISYAVSMKKQSASKIAFVVHANPEEDSFAVAFPFNKNIFVGNLRIMYKDLQLDDQPFYDEEKHSVTLKWKRRIYSADAMQIHQELKMMADSHPCIEVPLRVWKDTIEAIDNGKLDHAKCLIMHADADLNELGKQTVLPQSSEGYYIQAEKCLSEEQEIPEMQTEHFVDIQLALQPGDILQVQLTSSIKRGYQMPTVQLVHIKPKFEMCVDHVNSPITCFSRLADIPSRTHYNDTKEYIRIWKPLCEMESAANAVNESDIIIIENLQVKFNQELEGILKGSFFLPLQWINEWAIEFNLRNCFLCIRKRGLKLETSNVETSNVENSTLVDPKEFTWVAHGFTSNAEKLKNGGSKVEFYISHLPMETIPECVFQKNTHYTVEIIPKLIPDIRKENAVVNITLACDFVKAIALGQRIPKEVKSSLNIVRRNINGLPELNQSQHRAVDKALNNTFTLIQGPPGTGKTVVGVYIVHSFFEHNSKNKMKLDDPKDKEKKKVILYCGPSNKSVDVVAGYLMRFKDSLRPLRVYSQEVEMLDFPFPDCKLQFSQRTLRQDHSKPELRDITMHHRMRQDQNIYSVQIRDFDKRIKLAFEKKGELTAEEVKEYKNLLRDARAYELQQHDIILCTCTQSSTPVLTKTVTARQILIDECAMATEPQALIPLVCNKPEKIVLIGDHKQLRPIVRNEFVRKLGMAKSLFERYYTIHEKRAVMLDIQYRMHEDICEFPSNEFYDGNLKTGVEQQRSVFQVDHKTKPIVFGDVKGKTISLVVNTAQGNQNSKANLEERNKVITIAEKLVKTARIAQQSIVILSPYNAQVSEIRNELKKKKMEQIPVTTITKSQVCSLPNEEIEKQPERSWLSKHLGFVGDPNQINVAITRAKEGLCIIGDQELLMCSPTWRHLLNHYTLHNAVTGADKISVCSAT